MRPPFMKPAGERRIEAATWGLLIVWLGVMMLVPDEPEGLGLLGAGVILLVSALIQRISGWNGGVLLWGGGTALTVSGLEGLLEWDIPIGAILVIAVGVWMLTRALRPRRPKGGSDGRGSITIEL